VLNGLNLGGGDAVDGGQEVLADLDLLAPDVHEVGPRDRLVVADGLLDRPLGLVGAHETREEVVLIGFASYAPKPVEAVLLHLWRKFRETLSLKTAFGDRCEASLGRTGVVDVHLLLVLVDVIVGHIHVQYLGIGRKYHYCGRVGRYLVSGHRFALSDNLRSTHE